MTHEPTQQQIAIAQAAGDAAYAEAESKGRHPSICHDAYSAAYNAVREWQERSLCSAIVSALDQHGGRVAYASERVADVEPLAAKIVDDFHACDVSMTTQEQQQVQTYALASISRNGQRPAKDEAIEAVIYWRGEYMKPAPASTKNESTRQFATALKAWRNG